MMLPSDPVSIDLGVRRQDIATHVRDWTAVYYNVVDLIWVQCENLGLKDQRLEMTLNQVDGWTVLSPPEDEVPE